MDKWSPLDALGRRMMTHEAERPNPALPVLNAMRELNPLGGRGISGMIGYRDRFGDIVQNPDNVSAMGMALPLPSKALAARGFDTIAYHATGKDFADYKPSPYRGATFFANTPEGAVKGAVGGINQGGPNAAGLNIRPVYLRSDDIAGLSLTPKQKEWWNALPDRATENEMNTAFKKQPGRDFDYWWRVYDEVKKPDGSWEYVKLPMPKITLDEANKTGRDVYGRQVFHFGEGTEKKIAERTLKDNMAGWIQADEGGMSVAHANPTSENVRSVFAPEPIPLSDLGK